MDVKRVLLLAAGLVGVLSRQQIHAMDAMQQPVVQPARDQEYINSVTQRVPEILNRVNAQEIVDRVTREQEQREQAKQAALEEQEARAGFEEAQSLIANLQRQQLEQVAALERLDSGLTNCQRLLQNIERKRNCIVVLAATALGIYAVKHCAVHIADVIKNRYSVLSFEQRCALLKKYLGEFIVKAAQPLPQSNKLEKLKNWFINKQVRQTPLILQPGVINGAYIAAIAHKIKGFTGHDIMKLALAIQQAAYSNNDHVTAELIDNVVQFKIQQKQKEYEGFSAYNQNRSVVAGQQQNIEELRKLFARQTLSNRS